MHPIGDVTHHYAGNAALPSCLPSRLRGSDDLLHVVCEMPALQSLHIYFSERGAASLTPLDYELPLALTDTFSRATWLRELCVESSHADLPRAASKLQLPASITVWYSGAVSIDTVT